MKFSVLWGNRGTAPQRLYVILLDVIGQLKIAGYDSRHGNVFIKRFPAPCTTTETNAIIKDDSILTPNSGTINYSGIALHATGDTAAYTYFDDFAIQY